MSDTSQGPGWWQASDGKWYPPEQGATPHPPAPPGAPPTGAPAGGPGSAGAPGAPGQLAEWPQRVAATLLDFIPLFVAGVFFSISSTLGTLLYLVALAWILYQSYLNGETGQSFGKRVIGIKIIGEQTGQPIGGGMGIARYFIHFVDSICLIGYLFPLWDPKKQTFTDKILTTVVVAGIPKQEIGDAIKPPSSS